MHLKMLQQVDPANPFGNIDPTLFWVAFLLFGALGFGFYAYDSYRTRNGGGGASLSKDGSLSGGSDLRVIERSATRLVLHETLPVEMSAGLTLVGIICIGLGILGLPLMVFIGLGFLLPGLFFTAFSTRRITLDRTAGTLRTEYVNFTALGRGLRWLIGAIYQPAVLGTYSFNELTDVLLETTPGSAQRSPRYHLYLVLQQGERLRLTRLQLNDREQAQEMVAMMRPFVRQLDPPLP